MGGILVREINKRQGVPGVEERKVDCSMKVGGGCVAAWIIG